MHISNNKDFVRVSCSTKFHAFALAEQLEKHSQLNTFYTLYFSQKNTYYNLFHKRKDLEEIPVRKTVTFPLFLPLFMKWGDLYRRAVAYDLLVASHLKRNKNYKIFIGWSSMSLASMNQAKKDGKIVILERGSSHIAYQNKLLKEENEKFNISFAIDNRIIQREREEYELADFISIPSGFVKNSFIEMGIPEKKLFVNNYGSSHHFKPIASHLSKENNRFIVLYMGSLIIRKGLIYLFDALDKLDFHHKNYEAWFIGTISPDLTNLVSKRKKRNWRFFGHISHYDLPQYISCCDVAVQPSIEEGLSMVIPQILSCGIPVIASVNTGGTDIIQDGKTGYLVPIRDSEAIFECLKFLYERPTALQEMKATLNNHHHLDTFTWDNYGSRYAAFLNKLL